MLPLALRADPPPLFVMVSSRGHTFLRVPVFFAFSRIPKGKPTILGGGSPQKQAIWLRFEGTRNQEGQPKSSSTRLGFILSISAQPPGSCGKRPDPPAAAQGDKGGGGGERGGGGQGTLETIGPSKIGPSRHVLGESLLINSSSVVQRGCQYPLKPNSQRERS